MFLQICQIQLGAIHLSEEAAEVAQVIPLTLDLLIKLERPAALDLFIS